MQPVCLSGTMEKMAQEEVKIPRAKNLRSFIAIIVLIFFVAFVYSPDPMSDTFRGMASEALEATFDGVADRAAQQRSTSTDKALAHLGVIVGGAVYWQSAPESSKVVWHYCYGDGSQLILDSSYIKESPVVKAAIQSLEDGKEKSVSFRQDEDYRLSLALNPFKIVMKNNGGFVHIKVSQRIEFDTGKGNKKVKTSMRLGRFHVMIRDGFVHALGCKPFEAVSEWDN